jgi:cyclophilin family peptidyl-prolyl cis-trans isomerase
MSESAPLTVANFMTYAADGEYNKSQIHWANNTDFKILQTGKYRVNSDLSPVWLENVPTYSPVPLEAGVALTKGTIALARSANDLNSGANQFFFNLSDNSGLANSNGSWTEQYSVFATLLEGDLSRLNTVIEAIKLSFNSPTFDNYVPEGFTANYPSPAITSYWDVSPANWFYFNKVSISSGQTDGLQYEWHFLEGGNSDSFVVSLYNSILRIESVDTGEATLIVEASKEGFSPVTTAIKLTSAPNGVAWLFHDGTISNNGWLGSWYGWMTMNSFPYVSHLDHAFQYIPPSSTDSSFFVYDMEYGESPEKDSLGWFYTNENLYPWVYLYSQSIWLRHLQGTSKFAGPRWFYNSSGDWVTDYQLLNP